MGETFEQRIRQALSDAGPIYESEPVMVLAREADQAIAELKEWNGTLTRQLETRNDDAEAVEALRQQVAQLQQERDAVAGSGLVSARPDRPFGRGGHGLC